MKTVHFLRRSEIPAPGKQSPAFEGFEIAASDFGLLAMTTFGGVVYEN